MIKLPRTLPPPTERPAHIPDTVKWLSGEGAGSWFLIEQAEPPHRYEISRFSPEGKMECVGIFLSDKTFDLKKEYTITYPSNCSKVTIIQNEEKIRFNAEYSPPHATKVNPIQ